MRVSQQTGRSARIHNGFMHLPRFKDPGFIISFAAQLPEHAPATAAGTVWTKELFKVRP